MLQTLKHRLKCSMCSNRLQVDKKLNLDVNSTSTSKYLMNLDRGGLTVPSSFSFNICALGYTIFQCILNEYEDLFIVKENRRDLLIQICLKELDSGDESEICPSCCTSTYSIYGNANSFTKMALDILTPCL